MLIITQIIRSCAITNYITSSILFLLFLHSFSSHSSKDVRTELQKTSTGCISSQQPLCYGQKWSYYDEQVLNNNQIGAVTGNNLLLLAAEFILFMKIGKNPLSPILIHPPINILGFCENVAHLRG